MRVIAGEFRSRRLKSLAGMETRPTPDRLREALFDVLAPRIQGTVFLDAYAGSGAVGIEALSRGAAKAIFVERSRAAAAIIRDNLHVLGVTDRAQVFTGKVTSVLAHQRADIVFLDPPYDLEKEYTAALDQLGHDPPPVVIVQHSARFETPASAGRLERTRVLKQGSNALSFYGPQIL
jgi:16S rRNA (guanine(966)-N(2))-methyltransferase RsmD